MRRNRPGLVALFAVIVELVVVIAAGNQSVTRSVTNKIGTAPTSFGHLSLGSLLTFRWRLAPAAGLPAQHLWGAQLAAIAAFLVLSYLLVFAVSRGQGGLGQVFLGSWVSVLAAAVVGTVVRGVMYPFTLSHGDRLAVGVFGFPDGEVTFFGAVCGLLVAFLAMIVTAASRRIIEPEAVYDAAGYGAPGPERAYQPQPNYEQPPAFTPGYQQPAPQGAPTSGIPAYDAPSYSGPGYGPVEALGGPAGTRAPSRRTSVDTQPGQQDQATTVSRTESAAPAQQPAQQAGDSPPEPDAARPGPAAEQSAAEQPAAEQSAAEQSAAEQPAAEQSAAEQPAAEQSAAEQSAAEQPAAEQSAAERSEPAAGRVTKAPAAGAQARDTPVGATPASDRPSPDAPNEPDSDAHTEMIAPYTGGEDHTQVLPTVPDEPRQE